MFRRSVVKRIEKKGRSALIEALEPRELLSATAPFRGLSSTLSALPGTYDGTVHIGGRTAHGNHVLALTFSSQTSGGQLSGAMTVQGLGAYAFTGTFVKNNLDLVFNDAGPSAGRLIAHVNSDASLLVGRFIDLTANRQIVGFARATPGAAAAAASGIPATVGSTTSSSTFQQTNMIGSYTGPAHLTGAKVYQLSISKYNTTLVINAESDPGLLTGTLSLLNTTMNFTGTLAGGKLDFVLTGAGAGEGSAQVDRTGYKLSGSLTVRFAAGPIHGHYVLYNPSNPKPAATTTSGSSVAANGSGLPGTLGGAPTPVTVPPTLGSSNPSSGTGTTLGGSGGLLPTTGP